MVRQAWHERNQDIDPFALSLSKGELDLFSACFVPRSPERPARRRAGQTLVLVQDEAEPTIAQYNQAVYLNRCASCGLCGLSDKFVLSTTTGPFDLVRLLPWIELIQLSSLKAPCVRSTSTKPRLICRD